MLWHRQDVCGKITHSYVDPSAMHLLCDPLHSEKMTLWAGCDDCEHGVAKSCAAACQEI